MSSHSRILYVDKDKNSCELAGTLLNYSDLHCTVISTESAKEARLLIVKERFDLYIFDYWMPEISGVELCRCVRRFDSNTPVLFFSATARPADIAEGIEAGANEYLVKPNDLEKLSATVKRLLDKTTSARSRQSAVKTRVDIQAETSSEQVLQPGKLQPLIQKDMFQELMVDSLKTQSKGFRKIDNQIRGKKFNQNQIQTDEVSKLRIRPLLIGAAIFTVFVLHFISQITFFQSENLLSKQNSPKIENEQSVKTETQYEAKSLDIGTMPDKVTPIVPPETKIVPSNAIMKKQEPRESKAKRLRRAERILTGV